LKVFEIPKNFFQKVLWWGAGVKPLPCKPKFEKGDPQMWITFFHIRGALSGRANIPYIIAQT
jgi:hypothetical protein